MLSTRINRLAGIVIVAAALIQAAGVVHAQCAGDCSGDQRVTVDELIRAVGLALGNGAPGECDAADVNHDGQLAIDELVLAVENSLLGCGGGSPADLQIPDDFDYSTSHEVAFSLAVCTPNGSPFPGVTVMVLAPPAPPASDVPDDTIWRGSTDAGGRYESQISIPARYDAVRIVVSAAGMVNDVVLPIADGSVVHDFGCDP